MAVREVALRQVVTAEGMRTAEAAAVAAGVSLADLMGRAGAAVAAETQRRFPAGRVLVAVGGGNNGGDGWVAARLLHEAGRQVDVVSAADPGRLPHPADEAFSRAVAAGVQWSSADPAGEALAGVAVVIDALLGTGAKGAARGRYADIISAVLESGSPVLAADVPSGVGSDSGDVEGVAMRAQVTVCFGALKPGLVLEPGASLAGDVVVADIGFPAAAFSGARSLELLGIADFAALLPLPGPRSHKYSRGRLLVVGGAPGMTGAACLAAAGALRSGAGYVRMAVPTASLAVVEAKVTAPVKVGLPWDQGSEAATSDAVAGAAMGMDAVVAGPGLGRSSSARATVAALVERTTVPLILDADALFILAQEPGLLDGRGASVVITPHAGEAARLLGTDAASVEADRPAAVGALSRPGVTAVLKGPGTLIAGSGRLVLNAVGGPGLATLGTGDVLAGMIGAFVAQGLAPLDACALACHLHGAAGEAASRALTPVCCTALDVIGYLPEAIRPLLSGGPDDRSQGGPAWQI